VGDPDFALIDEAYPYLAKRLLTDDTPRLRAALKYMVYGKSKVRARHPDTQRPASSTAPGVRVGLPSCLG